MNENNKELLTLLTLKFETNIKNSEYLVSLVHGLGADRLSFLSGYTRSCIKVAIELIECNRVQEGVDKLIEALAYQNAFENLKI